MINGFKGMVQQSKYSFSSNKDKNDNAGEESAAINMFSEQDFAEMESVFEEELVNQNHLDYEKNIASLY